MNPTLSWIVMALVALLVGLLALAYLAASARLDRRENDLGKMPASWVERYHRNLR